MKKGDVFRWTVEKKRLQIELVHAESTEPETDPRIPGKGAKT